MCLDRQTDRPMIGHPTIRQAWGVISNNSELEFPASPVPNPVPILKSLSRIPVLNPSPKSGATPLGLWLSISLSIARVGFISENYGLISTEGLPDNIGVYIKTFRYIN